MEESDGKPKTLKNLVPTRKARGNRESFWAKAILSLTPFHALRSEGIANTATEYVASRGVLNEIRQGRG